MPYRRKSSYSKRRSYKKRYTRKRFNKRRRSIPRYSKNITRMTVRPQIIPDKTFLKLVKSSPFILDLPSGTGPGYTDYAILGNGFRNLSAGAQPISDLLDLDAPAGLQVWAQLYESFRIMGSKIDIRFEPIQTFNDLTQTPVIGVYPSRISGVGPITNATVLDQAYCKWQLLRSSGVYQNRITSMMNSKKMFGQKISTEDDYQGSMSYDDSTNALAISDPATLWYWHFFLTAADTTNGIQITGMLTITYYVQLEDRIDQSTRVPVAP